MQEILACGQSILRCNRAQIAKIEDNGELGKAIYYFIKHYDYLIILCHVKGAQIDNSRIEFALTWVACNRKM